MRILNLMLGYGRGGIEQAAFDYDAALRHAGFDVTSAVHPDGWLAAEFAAANVPVAFVKSRSQWDPFALRQLRRLLKQERYDALIAHGNRAVALSLKARQPAQPVIGVAHNYSLEVVRQADACFATTRDLVEELSNRDVPRQRLFHIPNLIYAGRQQPRADASDTRRPPVIGALGRFVEKKGFADYLHGLARLRSLGIEFTALLGGDGPEATALLALSKELELEDCLTFTGWVTDKNQFYDAIDIFVLPSRHEPFGIVLIEAMAHGLPCITTSSEGPCEIVTHEEDAILIDPDHPSMLAVALRDLLESPEQMRALGKHARDMVCARYDLPVIAQQLAFAVRAVVEHETSSTLTSQPA